MNPTQPLASAETSPLRLISHSATAHHIRGSSLLLVGKLLAQGLDLGSQILLVRYLSKADYGAFSYALSVALLFKGIAMFGLPDTLSRFVPLYREHKQYRAIFGSIVLAFGVVLGLGMLIVAGINLGLNLFHLKPTDDPQALRLLLILALLIPLDALDGLFTNLFAALASPRVIFFRQSILTPSLRLGLVLLLTVLRANVVVLALGYLAISLVGVLLYIWMFGQTLRDQGLLPEWHPRQFTYPAREIFSFALPLLASVLVWLLMESSDALLLGYFQNTEAVANFRAVLPMARLNQGVILTFALLYMPLAARLYARDEHAELADLYWQTAIWMTILSFPVFILTFSFARSLTAGIYGARYSGSVPIMALLSLGYFFHTTLGFNGLTLKVYKQLRYTVAIDIGAAVLNVAINLLLVPRWGALGAAIGTTSTLIVHNLLKQFGLWHYTGISLFRRQYWLTYGALFGMALLLLGLQATVLPVSIWIALPLGAAASLAVLSAGWHSLQIDKIFPELSKWPIVGSILRPLLRASS